MAVREYDLTSFTEEVWHLFEYILKKFGCYSYKKEEGYYTIYGLDDKEALAHLDELVDWCLS